MAILLLNQLNVNPLAVRPMSTVTLDTSVFVAAQGGFDVRASVTRCDDVALYAHRGEATRGSHH